MKKLERKKQDFIAMVKKEFKWNKEYLEKEENLYIVKSIKNYEKIFLKNCWISNFLFFVKEKQENSKYLYSILQMTFTYFGKKFEQYFNWIFFNEKDIMDMLKFEINEKGDGKNENKTKNL